MAKYGHVSVATFPVFILEFFRRIYYHHHHRHYHHHHHHHHHHRFCHWYKLKVKLSLYMPREALRASPIISRQSAHEVGIVLSPKDRPPLPPGDIPESSHGHSTARRIKSTKNSNDAIGNRTRYIECSSATNCTTVHLSLSLVIVICNFRFSCFCF